MLNKKKNNKGFTLVELLVVIAIIGILAVVAVPALFRNIEKAKIADLEADINSIRSASLSYFADNNEYPKVAADQDIAKGDINTIFDGQLENLSNPLEGTYKLSGTTGENLVLTIVTKNPLSEKGKKILADSINGIGTVADDKKTITVTLLKTDAPTPGN